MVLRAKVVSLVSNAFGIDVPELRAQELKNEAKEELLRTKQEQHGSETADSFDIADEYELLGEERRPKQETSSESESSGARRKKVFVAYR